VGVKNYSDGQVVFVDTPGVHKPTHRMNVRMVDVALDAMRDVDVLTLVVDVSVREGPGDRHLVRLLKDVKVPVVLALNKVDLMTKAKLLPIIDRYSQAHPFVELVPISAGDGTNIDVLETLFLRHLPDGDPFYPPDYVTDQSDRFLVCEIVREQVLQLTHAELPFSTAVVIDRFGDADTSKVMTLYCTILVERESQKPIVIGKGGSMIKAIGTAARIELERFLDTRVYLDLRVKVKSEWRDNDRVLDDLGLVDRARS